MAKEAKKKKAKINVLIFIVHFGSLRGTDILHKGLAAKPLASSRHYVSTIRLELIPPMPIKPARKFELA
eukprot:SAG31_NODE_5766_length_2336_cov_1.389808_2_plen_69_part_00